MGRAPCCDKLGLKKGPWTPEEDQKLIAYIQLNGHGSWRALPKNAGLLRCGKSCRLRWTNYLRPDIKRGRFSVEEEQLIIQLHAILGNRWSAISTHLPGRTDNEIKNYWNTHLKKKLLRMGVDPVTHKPKSDLFDSIDTSKPFLSSTLSHMAQWENARLEAEARLAREYMKFASCRQPPGCSAVQPNLDSGSTWDGDIMWETMKKDFSSTASLEQSVNTDFRKMLCDWEQSLQGHALNVCNNVILQDRICAPDLSFTPSNGVTALCTDITTHAALLAESLCDNLELKGVPKLEQNLSPSSCSLDSSGTDNSLQCESLLQQTEKMLKHTFRSDQRTQSPADKPHETCALTTNESVSFTSRTLSEAVAMNSINAFWSQQKVTTAAEVVHTDCPAAAALGDPSTEILSSDAHTGNIVLPRSSSLQLPPEMLLDLAGLQQPTKSSCTVSSDHQLDLSFSDPTTSFMQTKDYWSNVLKLVGSPPVLG